MKIILVRRKQMNIPEILKIEDETIHKTMTFKFIRQINNLLLYENIKTGCKQCFDLKDFIKLKDQKRNKTKYE